MTDEVNPAEVEAYWGAENLTRWPNASLREVMMPAASKEFLLRVGLPSPGRDISGWQLNWDVGLSQTSEGSGTRILGWNRGIRPILIDETRDGCVVWGAVEDSSSRYINASVEQFAASLIEMDKFRMNAERTADEAFDPAELARRISALLRKLKGIDETAIADDESLWSAIIFSMRLEL